MREEVYAGALDTWGLPAQILMLAEESSELSVAALHLLRDAKRKDETVRHLCEEIADVQIMIEQVCQALDLDQRVEDEMIFKMARLHERILKARTG
jgi:NTP pyrophosphatase (non-canonical NTP hydrolase)